MPLALITGASSGIGAATARLFVANGYDVALVARSSEVLIRLATELGAAAKAFPGDAADEMLVEEIATGIRAWRGVPDVIVNAAGAGQWKTLQATTPGEAAEMMRAPYLAAFTITHAFLSDMLNRGSGVLIHINSPASASAWRSAVAYIAARAALRGMHDALSQDLVGTGVKSCNVVFGKVASAYFVHNPGSEEHLPSMSRTMPTLTPEQCAAIILSVARRPRREIARPRMLALYREFERFFPRTTRWILRF